ncbi:protein phosphatase 1 regulatory subunit 15 [Nomia melanderi]|uniref:protein phosphatase 1 regulatory subunit 15 n=1 Tax=Nomia melanderi TaxID=2448451 RepID=UPI00130435CC|nr:protein PFC0760c [Nomia melanderi]XP_031841542.1 protein PFC0760c [Nomia melanderi]
MENMYSMNDTLNTGRRMSNPKQENMLYSVFNAINMIWERFAKVPASVMAGFNYPLSVTVVNNEGIISHEFFKDLATKKDTLNTDNVYIQSSPIKESLNIIENIHHSMFDEQKLYLSRIFNENTMKNLKLSYDYISTKNKAIDKSGEEKSVITEHCNHLLPTKKSYEGNIEDPFEHVYLDSTKNMKNIHNCKYINDSLSNKEQFSDCIESSVNDKVNVNTEPFLSTIDTKLESIQLIKQVSVSNMLTSMWQKVCDNVTDRFCRTDSIESDTTMKRSLSPKQRRKHNTIAKGRGRGRARSQLRRSGVSQTRHRKERTKHDLTADIQNDLKNWQDYEAYHEVENKESEDCFSLDEDMVDGLGTTETVNHATFTFADVEPKIQKPKTHKTCGQGMLELPTRMRYIPECIKAMSIFNEDFTENRYNAQRARFRPRLMSESSIDSEDSSCIVFEAESEVTYRNDLEDTDESDADQSSYDDEDDDDDDNDDDDHTCNLRELISPVQKVKFNLNPRVHVMVQWDFAYRAARKGPWEQMARDRERFKGRINCIGRILNPILTTQHRTHIWQERFARIDKSLYSPSA